VVDATTYQGLHQRVVVADSKQPTLSKFYNLVVWSIYHIFRQLDLLPVVGFQSRTEPPAKWKIGLILKRSGRAPTTQTYSPVSLQHARASSYSKHVHVPSPTRAVYSMRLQAKSVQVRSLASREFASQLQRPASEPCGPAMFSPRLPSFGRRLRFRPQNLREEMFVHRPT
jgi:hypothetical protein